MSKLVIVESPTKAATIKKYLGSGYEVAASVGHVRDLPHSRLAVDIENGFEPEYISIRGKAAIINDLKKKAKAADKVFLAPDPDREGEAISWHLAYLLGLDPKKNIRVTFNEITKTAVKEGIANARPIDINLVDAQQARRVLDRLVGYQISPFLWKKVKPKLSAGRVQSVTMKMIVDKTREIRDFVPEEYWTIDANLVTHAGKSFTAKYYGTKSKKKELADEADANAVLNDIKDADFIVSSIKHTEKKRMPLPPFMTSTLLQEASKRLNFSSAKTMKIAQELYEGISLKDKGTFGLITYMRTDSLRISKEVVASARNFIEGKFGKEFLPASACEYKTKNSAQDAHEAIRPTDPYIVPAEIKDKITFDQFRLYKLIWERFVACQMKPAVLDNVAVEITANNSLFKANGYTVKFPGFMNVWLDSKEDKEEMTKLPEVSDGEKLTLKDIVPTQKYTQPPLRYTENTLIKELEEKGIGRPSTYAQIIFTILSKDYVRKEGKFFEATALGEVVTELMEEHFKEIVDTKFTANIEDELEAICGGDKQWRSVLTEFYDGFKETLKHAEEVMGDARVKVPDEVSDVICEKCGRNMVVKMGRNGKFLACPGYPECKNAKSIVESAQGNCPVCGKPLIIKRSKKGNKFYGCSGYPTCTFMTWDDPQKDTCPKCKSTLFVMKNFKQKIGVHCLKEGCGYEEKFTKAPKESKKEDK